MKRATLLTLLLLSACSTAEAPSRLATLPALSPITTPTNTPAPIYRATAKAIRDATQVAIDANRAELADYLLFFQSTEDSCNYSLAAVRGDGSRKGVVFQDHRTNYVPISWSPDGTQLLLEVNDLGASDLYIFTTASGDLTRLTNTPDNIEFQAQWSPSGEWIVFSLQVGDSIRGSYPSTSSIYDIFFVHHESGQVVQVTDTPLDSELDPIWSPDGSTLAFTHTVYDEYKLVASQVFVTSFDAPQSHHLLADGRHPLWSPDGRWIAYESAPIDIVPGEWKPAIYLIPVDGSEAPQQVAEGWLEAWTPDSSAILHNQSAAGLFRTNLDDSFQTQLFNQRVRELVIAPNGERLAFIGGGEYGNEDVYVVDVDGENRKLISRSNGPFDALAWSPDSLYLSFALYNAGQTGRDRIYLASADGQFYETLTNSDLQEYGSIWYPSVDPPALAFPPTPTPYAATTDEMLAFYPLEVGMQRTYRVFIQYDAGYDAENQQILTESWRGLVTEQITGSRREGNKLILTSVFDGYPKNFSESGPEFITREVEYSLSESEMYLGGDLWFVLRWPLVDGQAWADFPRILPGGGCSDMWRVSYKGRVTVEAGTFENCLLVENWGRGWIDNVVCPGVGLVSQQVVHHNWADIREWELVEIRWP